MSEENKLNEANTTYSISQSKSKMQKSSLWNRLTGLFGWQATSKNTLSNNKPIEFVTVNPEGKVAKVADIENIFNKGYSGKVGQTLNQLFEAYLHDNSILLSDISDRQRRLNELDFMAMNDPFIARVVDLVADEATQWDQQDTIIDCEAPNTLMKQRIFELIDSWGITPDRIRGAIHDIELKGEAFWVPKITEKGVEKITPIRPNMIQERMEFNPMQISEALARRSGILNILSKDQKLEKLIYYIKENSLEDVSSLFDYKLLGFVLNDDVILPPWGVVHFRFNADHSEFYPYGRPHLLNALAPFKQSQSTMTLQSIARMKSFPITLYKVKVNDNSMDEGKQWETISRAKEQYENVGVNNVSGNSEVFTVNTSMWLPEGLINVEVVNPSVDIDFVGDLEIYLDRIAIATGIPKGYLVQEFGGFGYSAISLTEQFKPFARHVFSIQNTFLQGISDLIRLHFAITGEFAMEEPFILSMKFPSIEIESSRMDNRTSSLDLASSVFDTIQTVTGAEDISDIPENILKDILTKFTFLKPEDIYQWFNKDSLPKEEEEEEESDDDFGDDGDDGDFFDSDDDFGDDESDDTGLAAEGDIEESKKLKNKEKRNKLKEEKRKKVLESYTKNRENIYFKIIEKLQLKTFNSNGRAKHLFTKDSIDSSIKDMINFFGEENYTPNSLKTKTLREELDKMGVYGKKMSTELKEIVTDNKIEQKTGFFNNSILND